MSLVAGEVAGIACPHIQVATDQPVLACMASQWRWLADCCRGALRHVDPARCALPTARRSFSDHIPGREQAPVAVGCLEIAQLTGRWRDRSSRDKRSTLPPNKITLLVAPAASLAGTLQVVARSLETALHKLHELKFDLNQIVSGPEPPRLPPVAKDDLAAIGRTNDAILYGGRVVLWVQADDEQLAEIGPKVPSPASSDYGIPCSPLSSSAGEQDFSVAR